MIERLFDEDHHYGEPVFSQASKQIEELRKLLKKQLDTEGQVALGQLEDLYIRQSSAMLRDAYADGFSTAVKLLAEALRH